MTYFNVSRSILFLSPLALSLASGCIFSDDGFDDSSGPDTSQGRSLTCEAEVSVEIELEADLLVVAFRDSLAEMIGCGQLTADLAGGVQTGIVDAIIANRPDATPEGWTYAGDGTFTTSAAQASMQTRFFLASDFEYGSAGDPVRDNVFLVDSYFVGARVAVPDPFALEAELHFDRPGPLVELLGYGPNPQSPITVDLNAVATIGNKVAALHFESDIAVEDVDGEATIMYAVHTERMEANALLTGAPLRYELDSLVARRDDMEIDVLDWSSEFFSGGTLEGSVSFDIDIDASWTCEGSLDFEDLPRPSGD